MGRGAAASHQAQRRGAAGRTLRHGLGGAARSQHPVAAIAQRAHPPKEGFHRAPEWARVPVKVCPSPMAMAS